MRCINISVISSWLFPSSFKAYASISSPTTNLILENNLKFLLGIIANGIIFVLALEAINEAPLCDSPKSKSLECDRVPSGKIPTISPSFNNLILWLIAVLSNVPLLIGIAPVAFKVCFIKNILNSQLKTWFVSL